MAKSERTRTKHVLHYSDLSPRDFERLCLWLLPAEGFDEVDHIGASGQDDGCDLSATLDGNRWVCQCKRVIRFGPKGAEKEIDKILGAPEDEQPAEILFLVTCDITAETRRRARKKANPIPCTFWPVTELDRRVKTHDDLLDEFFKGSEPGIDLRGQSVGKQTIIAGDQHVHPPPPSEPRKYLKQISPPTADFVGREDEIAKLLAAFDGTGQGAVIMGARGMGGVGKTELAKVLAKRLKDRFPDGQIYFNLRGASEDESALPATAVEALSHVIRSFRPNEKLPEGEESLRGMYLSVLENKQVLLLMDNAYSAGQLVPATPLPDGCALIVTSRQHFSLSGMLSIDLDTLPPEDARKLLLKICPRIGEVAEALAEACDFLALALRLAGAALKRRLDLRGAGGFPRFARTYSEDLSNEKNRLRMLDEHLGKSGEAVGIEASLAMSYRQLGNISQLRWRTLAVFPSEFDEPALGSVWQLGNINEVSSALDDLLSASMVQCDKSTGRFRLHDLARDYARDQLGAKERAEGELHHAEHYLMVLGATNGLYEKGGNSILRGLTLFDYEWSNIDAGLKWAASMMKTNESAARLCSDYSDSGVYCLALRLHSYDHIAWFEAGLDAARHLKARLAEAGHLSNLGLAYAAIGERRKAITCYEEALAISKEISDRRVEAAALCNLGLVYDELGEPGKAIEYCEQALVICEEMADERAEGITLANSGIAYANLGEPRKAIDFYERSLVISRKIGDRRGEGSTLANAANAYRDLGEWKEAIGRYQEALAITRHLGDRFGEANVLGNLGTACSTLGAMHDAIDFYERSHEMSTEIGNPRGEGVSAFNLAGVLPKVGRGEEAIAYAEKAVAIYETIESPDLDQARALLEELRKQAD